MTNNLKNLITLGKYITAVESAIEDILDPEEEASRFCERYQDEIYDAIIQEIAEELFDLPF